MKSSSYSVGKRKLFQKSSLSLTVLTILLMTLYFINTTGCALTKREVQYARATKKPDEIAGFMRLAQDVVKVVVDGGDNKIGDFNAAEKSKSPKKENLSAYIVIHEQDVAAFVRNTARLQAILKKHPNIEKELEPVRAEIVPEDSDDGVLIPNPAREKKPLNYVGY